MTPPEVTAFFDEATHTVTYVAACPRTGRCAIVDPVRDYDAAAGRTATRSADALAAFLDERGLEVECVLETHVHADHLSAGSLLAERLGAWTGIGERVREVQATFARLFDLDAELPPDGSQFDRLLADGERFPVGDVEVEVQHTPGHTPACVTYVMGDAAFVGDTLFMPDFGTARTDFPGGDARTLYRSIRRILALPPATRVLVGHDYGPGGRDYAWETTVAEERAANLHVRDGIDEDAFVAMREARDATLPVPALLLPAVQVNIRGGRLPPPAANGIAYLKIPLDAF